MKRKREAKSVAIYLRVTPATKKKFMERAERIGVPSDVLRELIQAFIEERVTVIPPPTQKESLYNVPRTEN